MRKLGAAPLLGGAALLVALMIGGALAWRHHAQAPAPVAEPLIEPAAAAAPVVQAGPSQIAAFTADQLQAELSNNGDWQVHRLAGNPAVLVIEFPTLAAQGEALNRAAALIEKKGGSRSAVLSDTQLQALIRSAGDSAATFYYGHDYTAADLARFYSLAQGQGTPLNTAELRLRQLLQDAGLLSASPGAPATGWRGADPGALVSFPAVQGNDPRTPRDESVDPARRASVMRHELSHGRYFTDRAYREHCAFFWRSLLREDERELWRRYLASQGYDRGNEDLMINETQALLMHTPDKRDFNAAELRLGDAELEGLRDRFKLGWGG